LIGVSLKRRKRKSCPERPLESWRFLAQSNEKVMKWSLPSETSVGIGV
jgi:hypothetical protein